MILHKKKTLGMSKHTMRKKVSVFGVFLVRIFRNRTEYGPEKLRIEALFTQ